MSEFHFSYFRDVKGGTMARVETLGEKPIPLNIHIDNAREMRCLPPGPCRIEVCGIGTELSVYPSEEACRASGEKLTVSALIPMGTFPPGPEHPEFRESPHILFCGRVLEAEDYPDTGPECPNCGAVVETAGLTFRLIFRAGEPVKKGCVISGVAWLFGDMEGA